jgi:CO/xanthine dehydrogenase FAD-binding subunit
MPILNEFEYSKPATIKEAVRLLSKYKKPAVLAGGTDLVNNLKVEVERPDAVVDIKGIKELSEIVFKDSVLTIGAAVTFSELIDSKIIQSRFPVIAEVAKTVGSVGIRNRATMVGNICSAVACADSGPLLMVYDAMVLTRGPKGRREVAAAKWFKDNKRTDIRKGELVTAIEIALPARQHAGCYVKLGRYHGEDLSQAGVLILALPGKRYRVAFGAVGPVPIRASKIEEFLEGRNLGDDLITKCQAMIPELISPITDIRASKEYRVHMCQVMFARGIRAAASRLTGDGPEYGVSLI